MLLNKNKSVKNLIANIPNILTISRLFLTLPLIIFLEINKTKFVFALIILGGITDYFDGYFARKLNLKTKFGAIIDPLADKIFLLIPLLWLSKMEIIPFWSLALILFRELIISALRTTMKDGLPASQLGKYKTFFFFIALVIFFQPFSKYLLFNLGITCYWLGFILTLLTFIDYLRVKKNTI
ncbi:CDP-diacylglycerol--glycerol-3-phosphate 3-phosphatidyltransferase [uncultured Prochlorococcus sp.]|uniref:CDP-diacylglycerol--glycerol-3-phosphate 3-phosphatidyltransferase n=1 Tax=uncultured Prochlorococcus sp. TaxID=159733 RepID=UPI00258970D2|nr:CDP-diacylglycerol--glycerol-3-phosphate 3-phosphatidyltransferase [uncultured Prochlorococcus sp.]